MSDKMKSREKQKKHMDRFFFWESIIKTLNPTSFWNLPRKVESPFWSHDQNGVDVESFSQQPLVRTR